MTSLSLWTAFADVLFTFGGRVGFFESDENEYYFLFYSFLLAMSEFFLHMSGDGNPCWSGISPPPLFFLGVAIGLELRIRL